MHTDTDRQRPTEKQTDTLIDTDIQTLTQTETHTYKDGQTDTPTDRHTHGSGAEGGGCKRQLDHSHQANYTQGDAIKAKRFLVFFTVRATQNGDCSFKKAKLGFSVF